MMRIKMGLFCNLNTRLAQKCLFGILGFRKTPFGLTPSAVFGSITFLQPYKTYGFAYSDCKNVANLKREAKWILVYGLL